MAGDMAPAVQRYTRKFLMTIPVQYRHAPSRAAAWCLCGIIRPLTLARRCPRHLQVAAVAAVAAAAAASVEAEVAAVRPLELAASNAKATVFRNFLLEGGAAAHSSPRGVGMQPLLPASQSSHIFSHNLHIQQINALLQGGYLSKGELSVAGDFQIAF
jgi:hypothetical protein